MISTLNLSIISLVYFLLLFAIAYYGDKFSAQYLRQNKPIIVAFCLPIFFTAWSIYGTPIQALKKGWFIPPTTIGAILIVTFAIPLIKQLIKLAKQQRSTSIAGFISGRYQNSKLVALVITSVVMLGMLPYLALQLDAISTSFDLFSSQSTHHVAMVENRPIWQDTTFAVTLLMALFSMIFGTRHVDLTEHHNGLMLAVAFESIVKLVSVIAVGYFIGYQLFDGPSDMLTQALNNEKIQQVLALPTSNDYGTAILLGMAAVLCLPWLFHLLVVESNDHNDANTAQWVFPIYAVVISFFLLLIFIGGVLFFQDQSMDSEMVFLAIPMQENATSLALIAYLGGLSAATSMVIVATITLSTMISNDMIMPVILRQKNFYLQLSSIGNSLLVIRRWAIAIVLFMAYWFYRLVGASGNLGAMGLVSITLIVQLLPALIGALYWQKRHKHGVVVGILLGTLFWGYCLLTPSLVKAGWITTDFLTAGPWSLYWLRPQALFGFDSLQPLTHGVLWSLGVNIFAFIIVSLYFTKQTVKHTVQYEGERLSNASLLHVAVRFLGEEQAKLALLGHCNQHNQDFSPNTIASKETVLYAESLLAGIIGPSSAKHIINLTRQQAPDASNDTEQLLQKASDVLKFSRELLQASIDNMSQGITVIDNNQRLVAWNKRCIELFNYPQNLFYVGSPIQNLVRHNAINEVLDEDEINQRINEQISQYSQRKSFIYKRSLPNGAVIEVRGEPIPNKGYVITYTDISQYQQMVNALQESNEHLEHRVAERTNELTQINKKLGSAKMQAEAANVSKTQFLAAASHDLAQPLNAARLFTTSLQHLELAGDPSYLIDHLSDSLQNAESLIKELFDIAKIDAGVLKKVIIHFPVEQVLSSLTQDFSLLMQEKQLTMRTHTSKQIVQTDRKLLRRILQNLLANALRYTQEGRVVLGCRRLNNAISIEVWDTGIGIAKQDINDIFIEFKRINHRGFEEGSGLGLATVQRLCLLLDLSLEVTSEVGRGSVFKVIVPLGNKSAIEKLISPPHGTMKKIPQKKKLSILCIDNDEKILIGMKSLLSKWQHKVVCASHYLAATEHFLAHNRPDLILVDYHLDEGETGLALVNKLFDYWQQTIPCIVISANPGETVKTASRNAGFLFLQKPIKPHVLRAALSRITSIKNYH